MDGDPLAATSRNILRQEDFPAAALHYVDGLLQWRDGPRLLNKLSSSHTRSQIIGFVLYLHFAQEAGRIAVEEGPTFANILALCERRKQGSPRVLKTVLGLMRLAGFITLSRGKEDRRIRFYRPTSRMMAFVREWYAQTFGCFDVLRPGARYAARITDDPGFLPAVIIAFGKPYTEQDIALVNHFPEISRIFSLEGGFTVAASLVKARLIGRQTATFRDLDGQYGTSKSQKWVVLKEMERMGLIDLGPEGAIDNVDPLCELFMRYIARELALYARFSLGLFSDENTSHPRETDSVAVAAAF